MDAFIPTSYIESEEPKLEIYKRIAAVETDAEREEMEEELVDRFGPVPECVENLLKVSVLKGGAHALYITQLTGRDGKLSAKMRSDAKIDIMGVKPLLEHYGGALRFYGKGTPEFVLTLPAGATDKETAGILFEKAQELVRVMTDYLLKPGE